MPNKNNVETYEEFKKRFEDQRIESLAADIYLLTHSALSDKDQYVLLDRMNDLIKSAQSDIVL